MKTWVIEISQNGWEYTGWVTLKGKELIDLGKNDEDFRTIKVDGVEITFDEEIRILK